MATLTLIKENEKSKILMLILHFLKGNNDTSEIIKKETKNCFVEPTVQYGEKFCFEYESKEYSGFLAAMYALIRFYNFFDYLFNKDEEKVTQNEEFLFSLESKNFRLKNWEMKCLNIILTKKSFLISEKHMSIVDIVYFFALYKWVEKSKIKDKMEYMGLCRWVLYIQEVLLKDCDFMKPVEFREELQKCINENDTDKNAEKEKKKKEGKGKEASTSAAPAKGEKKEKKKKEKKNEKTKESGKGKEETRALDDITRLNMVVGYVEHVEVHPDADNLYCLKVNVGEEKVRDICGGMRKKKSIEDLLNKHVIVLANLKEKALRGKKSHGMILCGLNDDKLELLQPPEGVKIGERINCENVDLNLLPDKVLSSDKAKNPFFHIQPNLILKNGVAYFKDAKLVSSKGEIVCALREGSIS